MQNIVIKIGTDSICKPDGDLYEAIFPPLSNQIAALQLAGNNVVVVSSGAVACGRHKLGIKKSDWETTLDKATFAAVGQPVLIGEYDRHLQQFGLAASQILLENHHFTMADKTPRYNLRDLLFHKFAYRRLIPVLNENDPLSRIELDRVDETDPNRITDNDGQAREVGKIIRADIIITISTHCVHTKNPKEPGAEPIAFINLASKEHGVEGLGISTEGSSAGGTGTMGTKIDSLGNYIQDGACGERAAYVITALDVIANEGLLHAVRGEAIGTRIVCERPAGSRHCPHKAICRCAN